MVCASLCIQTGRPNWTKGQCDNCQKKLEDIILPPMTWLQCWNSSRITWWEKTNQWIQPQHKINKLFVTTSVICVSLELKIKCFQLGFLETNSAGNHTPRRGRRMMQMDLPRMNLMVRTWRPKQRMKTVVESLTWTTKRTTQSLVRNLMFVMWFTTLRALVSRLHVIPCICATFSYAVFFVVTCFKHMWGNLFWPLWPPSTFCQVAFDRSYHMSSYPGRTCEWQTGGWRFEEWHGCGTRCLGFFNLIKLDGSYVSWILLSSKILLSSECIPVMTSHMLTQIT